MKVYNRSAKAEEYKLVYLDYAATSPIKTEVRAAMMPYLAEKFGNPSSIHTWGRQARTAVDQARGNIAKFLNCSPGEIIFTSGGTEADNLAIKGLVFGLGISNQNRLSISPARKSQPTRSASALDHAPRPVRVSSFDMPRPHIVTSQIEHHAVLKSCKALEKSGVELTYIKPNREGIVEVGRIKKAIKTNTVLVSVIYVNNEIGTIQPIREIGKMIEKENGRRSSPLGMLVGKRIFFHTDAVQATEYLSMDVDYLHVDLLTISGHKIGAPKGTGALFIRKGTPMIPMMHGGEQEMGYRAGTENVAGIISLGKAVELIKDKDSDKVTRLRDYFIDRILKEIPDVELNGSKELRSPNNVNLYFRYIEGESILLNLDLAGIAASSGSACTSQSLEPSHVLMAVYDEAERAHGSVRFTLGEKTSKEEIDYTVDILKRTIEKLRKISPLTPRLRSGQTKEKK